MNVVIPEFIHIHKVGRMRPPSVIFRNSFSRVEQQTRRAGMPADACETMEDMMQFWLEKRRSLRSEGNPMWSKRFIKWLLVPAVLLWPAALMAQMTTGTILGRIVDPSGAAVPGAQVTIT